MNEEVKRLISKFNLKPHPEGGYFSSGFRSNEFLRSEYLPKRYESPRNLYSSIHFMVTANNHSCFHRLNTDEVWHFYGGDPLELHLIWDKGRYTKVVLSNEAGHEKFQTLVKRSTWMAASTSGERGYSLCGCTLGPGFEYTDFELADPVKLIEAYPEHRNLIMRYSVQKTSKS